LTVSVGPLTLSQPVTNAAAAAAAATVAVYRVPGLVSPRPLLTNDELTRR